MVAFRNMPLNVRRYLLLMYGSLALSFAALPLTGLGTSLYRLLHKLFELNDLNFLFGFSTIVLLIIIAWIFIVWSLASYKLNWLRWVLAGLIVLAIFGEIEDAVRQIRLDPALVLLSSVVYLAHAVAISLLFTGDARPWFSRKSSG
ncbi:MAG: hypothetical protein WBQ17_17125 [Rhizomicrobium sp.]